MKDSGESYSYSERTKGQKKLLTSKSPLKYKGLVSAPNPQLPTVFSIISAPSKMTVFFRAFGPMWDLCCLLCLDKDLMNCWDGHNRIRWFLYLTPYSLLKESFKTQQVSSVLKMVLGKTRPLCFPFCILFTMFVPSSSVNVQQGKSR